MNFTYVSTHIGSAVKHPEANIARSSLLFRSCVFFIHAAGMLLISMLIQSRSCWVCLAAFVTFERVTDHFSAVLRMGVVFVQSQAKLRGKSLLTNVTLNCLRW